MNHLLDAWLNKISMYRLLSIALSVLWANAVLFSLLGILDYDPLALLVSGSILIIAATISNRLLGRLFGVHTHEESSYITALILFFIFPPSLELNSLLTLGLVGVIASATKYILAVRGRHIFNPAAASALIVSIIGLAYATWWVASPVLLPVTLICAYVILYRTGRLAMGLLFLLVAIPGVLLVLFSFNTPLNQAVPLLASWPLLFFVGFMLSEPLTQPPRRWQQLLEAGGVGGLFALPIHLGYFALNPAMALLIGNLIAFAFSYRRQVSLTLKAINPLTPSTSEYIFEAQHAIAYEPGQYMEITVPHAHKDGRGIRRTFSMTSAPNSDDVTFGIKFYDRSSSFKQALAKLPIGAAVQATRIAGDFTLPKDPTVPVVLIAGGIGITPFISHLASLDETHGRDIVLLYAASDASELAYADVLERAGVRVIALATGKHSHLPTTWIYDSKSLADPRTIQTHVRDIEQRHAYIAGPPQMVAAAKQTLKQLKAKRIVTDSFTGY